MNLPNFNFGAIRGLKIYKIFAGKWLVKYNDILKVGSFGQKILISTKLSGCFTWFITSKFLDGKKSSDVGKK